MATKEIATVLYFFSTKEEMCFMKLKTRLTIACLSIILGPILLWSIVLFSFGSFKIHTYEQNFGVSISVDNLVNSAQTVNESTHALWEEMHVQAAKDAELFLDDNYLDTMNEQLKEKLSCLIIIKDGELIYNGGGQEGNLLARPLAQFDDGEDEDGRPVYINQPIRALVKPLSIQFSDGSAGMACIVTPLSALVPGFRSMVFEVLALVVLVMVVIVLLMIMWVYRGIKRPIDELRAATEQIASGNLDFTLEARGDDEISNLTRDFEQMRRQLKESEEQRNRYDNESRELISNISHDLKTPITTVKGYVEGIMDGVADTPEKMDRYIRTIYNKANDMDRLINELTFYSKIDTNRIPYNFVTLNVADFFDDCAEELSINLEDQKISFCYENLVDRTTQIIADPEQLKRVVDNIVGNSVKYMDKTERRIELRILDAEDFIQVELEDNGKGIAPKELASIFDRFYRADAARSSTGGSGIGLSIVRKIIEDHSGNIWAKSKLGQGTTMCIVIRKYRAPV